VLGLGVALIAPPALRSGRALAAIGAAGTAAWWLVMDQPSRTLLFAFWSAAGVSLVWIGLLAGLRLRRRERPCAWRVAFS
jgi:hypothetical protein